MTAAGDGPSAPSGVLDRVLGPDDLAGYLRLREGSFGYPASDDVLDEFRKRLPNSFGAFVGAELAAVVTQHAYRAYVAGRAVPVSGIGGVTTAPEHRRAGHAARLLARALAAARDAGTGWSLLYPFDAPFYGRYGWASVPTGVPISVSPSRLPTGTQGRLRRVEGPARAGLGAAYARVAATRTFADTREIGPWDAWEELDGRPGGRLLRYVGDDAFAALALHDDPDRTARLAVLDLGWRDAAGRDAVWGAIAAFRGHAGRVTLEVPWDDPAAGDLVRAGAVAGPTGLMARVVDVGHAVTPLRAVSDDDRPLDLPPRTVRVHDPFAPWNDGSWRLQPGPDGTDVAPAHGGADATLDVRALALLLAGAAAPADVRRVGWAEGDGRALADLAALSGGRRPYRSPVDRF